MEDISDLASLTTSQPEEAATNISHGNMFSVDPRYAAENKEIFDEKAATIMRPRAAEEPVASYMRQSSEHAAVVTKDVDHLNFIARQAQIIGDYAFDRPNVQHEIVELNLKRMNNGGQLDSNDTLKLDVLNHQAGELANKDYNLSGPIEKIPAWIAGTMSDLGSSIVRGARKGLMESPFAFSTDDPYLFSPKKQVGKLFAGLYYGTMVKDPFDTLTAGTYNELSNLRDDAGNPKNLDHETKLAISRGVGIVGTSLINGAVLATPFLKPFANPASIAAIANTPAKAAMLASLGKIAQTSIVTGGVGAGNEVAKIVGDEIALAHGTDEAGFWNAIGTATQKLDKYAPRVGKAALEGAAVGALIQAPLEGLAFGRTKQNFVPFYERPPAEGPFALPPGPSEPPGGGSGPIIEGEFSRPTDAEFAQAKLNDLTKREGVVKGMLENPEKLSPQQKMNLEKELGEVQGKIKVQSLLTPENPKSVMDLTPGEEPSDPTNEAFKAVQLNEALHQMNDVQKATNVSKVAPTQLMEVNKRTFEAAKFKEFYTTLRDMKAFATTEEAGLKAREIIDPSNVAAGQMNAVIALKPHDVMDVAKDYPQILDHISHSPKAVLDGRLATGMNGKDYVEALNRADEARSQVMQSLGIKEEDVQPEQGNMGGQSVATLPKREEAPQVKPDFEAAAKRTLELLSHKKATEAYITEKTELLKQLEEKEVPDINDKELRDRLKLGLKNAPKQLEEIDEEIAQLKSQVVDQLKEIPPGKMLAFPFDPEQKAIQAEMKFGREPTFSDALRTVLPEQQVAKFDEAVLRARQHVTSMVHDQAVHEMNKVISQTEALAKEDAYRAELDRIAHDPNYAVVDKFRLYQIANSKGKAKRSMYAIDPATLPDDLLKYIDHPRLKAHKVFAKGANHVDESARALGFDNGRALIEVLAKTPTREEILKARAKAYDADIELMVQKNVELDHISIMMAFTDKAKAYHETMRYLKDTDWSKTKFGIKKIALPLPPIEEIENEVKEAVKKMKVGELIPSKYVVGERQSYRDAVEKFLAGDLAGAFRSKELAMRNALMQKEIRKAIGQINRAQRFARKLEQPAAKGVFKNAGKMYVNGRDEILDVFNLNPNKKQQSEQDSYAKFVKRMVEQGRGDFTIPKRLSDIRQSIDEMTVEQVLVAEDRLRTLYQEAKWKHELIENKNKREDERSIDRVALEAVRLADQEHPVSKGGGGGDNVRPIQETKSLGQSMRYFMQDKMSALSTMEHTLRYYDQGKMSGFWQETFMHPIKGDGKWNLKSGYSKENAMAEHFAQTARAIMENYNGEYDPDSNKSVAEKIATVARKTVKAVKDEGYDAVEKKMVHIPEFKNYAGLGFGNLSKGDLMVMWAYKGDPQGRAYLQNNFKDAEGKGLTLETIEKVLDEHLEERDVVAMQYAVDMYKEYQAETRDLQMRDKGEEVVFIKGVPNKHKGKYYPGGYVHLNFRKDWADEEAKRAYDFLNNKRATWYGEKDGKKYGRQFAAEQTEQGRLERRTGSSLPLDLSLLTFWRGHEEVIYDLSYREAVKDALKLLRDKRIRNAMVRMGGEARYKLVLSTIIELAGRQEAMNENYFADPNRAIKNVFGHLQNNFNITVLGMNLMTSTPIQYASLAQLVQNMGLKGLLHLEVTNNKMLHNPHLWHGFYNFGVELDPTIGHFMDQLQNKIASVVNDIIPSKTWTNKVPGMTLAKAAHEKAVNFWMAPMALADIHLKVMGAMASYSQFMAGHSDNWPIEKVMALSEEERHQRATAYVRQISRLSLTHGRPEDKALFQKTPLTTFFANYWNDARNVLNNLIQRGFDAKWSVSDANAALGEGGGGHGGGEPPGGGGSGDDTGTGAELPDQGRIEKAGKQYSKAGSIILMTLVTTSIARWIEDKLRGIQETPDQWDWNLKTPKAREEAGKKMLHYMLMSPGDQLFSVVPIVREAFWAEQMPDKVIRGFVDKTKTVQIPIQKELSDIATAGNTVEDMFKFGNSMSDYLFYITNLDNKETKAILNAFSFTLIPLPVNAYSQWMRLLEAPLNSPRQGAENAFERLNKAVGGALRKSKELGPDHLELGPKETAELEKLQLQIQPEVAEIPVNVTDKIKMAMSGGDWSKPDGVYGIDKNQWDLIKFAAPDLGLTDSGRISKNLDQQEKAMDFLLHYNSQKLAEANIRVTSDSLYGAHRFGVEEYEKLYKASRDTKLKTVFSAETIKKNPDLAEIKTVGQLKDKLANELSKTTQKVPVKETVQLTEPTSNVED